MQTDTVYHKPLGNAIFANIGDGQVLDLLRERLTTISDYDLTMIAAEARQQLQMRQHEREIAA